MDIVQSVKQEQIDRHHCIMQLLSLKDKLSASEMKVVKALAGVIDEVPTIPRVGATDKTSESELIVSHIHPVLKALFSDPAKDVSLRWINQQAEETKPRSSSTRPDAIISQFEQLATASTMGHVEAKAAEKACDDYRLAIDLIRIAKFNKDAIDNMKMASELGVQVVGPSVTIYVSTLQAEAIYTMVEICHFKVPMSLDEVPHLLMEFDQLLYASDIFWRHCRKSDKPSAIDNSRRSSLSTPKFKQLVSSTRSRNRECNIRF
ncbi:unnamed protein product [Umbelopsis vinacea]